MHAAPFLLLYLWWAALMAPFQTVRIPGPGGAAVGGGGPAYANSWSGVTGATPLGITVSPSTGSALAVWVSGTSGMNFSFADNQSSSYTVLASSTACDARTCGWAYLCNIPSGITTITVSNSGSANDYAAIVIEVSGAASSSCLDTSTSVPTSATSTSTPTSSSLATTAAKTTLLAFAESFDSSITFSSNGSYTLATQQQHDGGGIIGATYQNVTSSGSYSPALTMSTTAFSIAVGMAFK